METFSSHAPKSPCIGCSLPQCIIPPTRWQLNCVLEGPGGELWWHKHSTVYKVNCGKRNTAQSVKEIYDPSMCSITICPILIIYLFFSSFIFFSLLPPFLWYQILDFLHQIWLIYTSCFDFIIYHSGPTMLFKYPTIFSTKDICLKIFCFCPLPFNVL